MTSQEAAAGTISGYIPAEPEPAAATLYLPALETRDHLRVVQYDGPRPFVAVTLAGGLAIHLHTRAQAREFIRAFALALEMLTPSLDGTRPADLPGPVRSQDSPLDSSNGGESTLNADRAGEPDLVPLPDVAQDADLPEVSP